MSAAECKHGFGPPHMPIYSPILLPLHREVKRLEIWRGQDLSIAFERRDGSCAGFNVPAVPVGAGVQPGNKVHTFKRTALYYQDPGSVKYLVFLILSVPLSGV
jgi:hypothetical protein